MTHPDLHEIHRNTMLSIWWSFYWRFLLLAGIVGSLLGLLIGFVLSMSGFKPAGPWMEMASNVLEWLISIPVSLWATHQALSRKHGPYTLVCVETERILSDDEGLTEANRPSN